jgi:hypothetical protein
MDYADVRFGLEPAKINKISSNGKHWSYFKQMERPFYEAGIA